MVIDFQGKGDNEQLLGFVDFEPLLGIKLLCFLLIFGILAGPVGCETTSPAKKQLIDFVFFSNDDDDDDDDDDGDDRSLPSYLRGFPRLSSSDEWGRLLDSYQGPVLNIDGFIHVEIYDVLLLFAFIYLYSYFKITSRLPNLLSTSGPKCTQMSLNSTNNLTIQSFAPATVVHEPAWMCQEVRINGS